MRDLSRTLARHGERAGLLEPLASQEREVSGRKPPDRALAQPVQLCGSPSQIWSELSFQLCYHCELGRYSFERVECASDPRPEEVAARIRESSHGSRSAGCDLVAGVGVPTRGLCKGLPSAILRKERPHRLAELETQANTRQPPGDTSDSDVLSVLVVDDDEGVRAFVHRICENGGIRCVEAPDGLRASELLAEHGARYDVILLDITMPGETGWQFLQRLRDGGDETPVIFLSGHKEVEDKVKGLELGADDFIGKPFAGEELLARIYAVVRRRNALPVLTLGDVQIDLGRRTVQRAGERIDLSRTEFDVLHGLVEARGRTVPKAELLERVWGIEDDHVTKVVEVSISRLRAKLDRDEPHLIETVVRRGYRIRLPGSRD